MAVDDPPGISTASDELPSGLSGYSETVSTQGMRGIGGATSHPASAADQLSMRICSIQHKNRDFPGATAPTPTAFNDALSFAGLLPSSSPVPHVSVADDGEINFFRRREGLYIDVGFFGDNQIHYYVQVEALGIDVADSRPFDGKSLPRELVIALTTE